MYKHFGKLNQNSSFTPAAQRKNSKAINRSHNPIQAKLSIGKPNDKYEQEADRVAQQIVNTPSQDTLQTSCPTCMDEQNRVQTKQLINSITPLVQTQPAEEEELQAKLLLQRQVVEEDKELQTKALLQKQTEEDEEEELQTKSFLQSKVELQTKQKIQQQVEEEEEIQSKGLFGKNVNNSNRAPFAVENTINQSKGNGRPLSHPTRSYMESRFGVGFSGVRIHSDSTSVQMNKELNSQAFTVGNDIYFNSGRYSPENESGKQLLAHELTHVIQQGTGENGIREKRLAIQRWAISGDTATCNSNSDTLWGLSRSVSRSGRNWPCIRPIYMRSSKATGTRYYNYVRRGDRFDVSNLRLATGPSVNLRLVTNADPHSLRSQYGRAIVRLYGGQYTTDPESDIELAANFGEDPIRQLTISGHAGGARLWGDVANWTVSNSRPETPTPTKERAEMGFFPRRCWFTRNASVRIVGCCSQTVATHFRNAFLRRGSQVTGTNQGLCGWDHPTIYMTFDPSCGPACPWPPLGTRCATAACMNGQAARWNTLLGRL